MAACGFALTGSADSANSTHDVYRKNAEQLARGRINTGPGFLLTRS
jgi:hypothetical protein